MTTNKILYSLLFIRKFEEALLDLFQKGKLNGTTHTCIGQEEIPVAIMPLLIKEDYIFSKPFSNEWLFLFITYNSSFTSVN